MKIHMTVEFENDGLNASTSRDYEFEDNMTLKQLMDILTTDADTAMLDYCEDEYDEEENLGGTKISIEDIW